MERVYFVSGIDTDTGKSIVTGIIARTMMKRGVKTITQKFIQTGCYGISEDILKHREIMGCGILPEDEDGTTSPYVMSYPCSPHLAAEIDGIEIDLTKIDRASERLLSRYELVLLEGAGGLYVPVTRDYMTIDYVRDRRLPLILVTSSKLGSVNHTIMSLELCRIQGIDVPYLIYNDFPGDSQPILEDSKRVIADYLKENFPNCKMMELPILEGAAISDVELPLK